MPTRYRRAVDSHYPLPRVEIEPDWLDALAYGIDYAMGGNRLAPIVDPRQVLDVGCGTGEWCASLARRFPHAQVVGVDIKDYVRDYNLTKTPPPNFRFARVNVMEGLPFTARTFDYTHQRNMVAGIPFLQFKGAVAELVRVTTPGGYVELVECLPNPTFVVPEGPMTAALWGYFRRLGDRANLDSEGRVARLLEIYLRDAGATNIDARTVAVPIGEWGDPRDWQGISGRLLQSSFRALFLALIPRFKRYGLEEGDARELIDGFLAEATENSATIRYKTVYGQAPA